MLHANMLVPILARQKYSKANCKFRRGRVAMYLYKVVNGCIGLPLCLFFVVINLVYVPNKKKSRLFFSTEISKKYGNTSELLKEHRKEILARGSCNSFGNG